MGRLLIEAKTKTLAWAAKGGKNNRKKQHRRMIAFASHLERHETVSDWKNVGTRHVIRFYKRTTHLSDSVRYQHCLAIRHLFKIIGNPNIVPKPFPIVGKGTSSLISSIDRDNSI